MALMNYTFNDMTTKDMFDFRFNESEEFLGHRFVHIGSGIFKAEEFFDLSLDELKKELRDYSNYIGAAGCLNVDTDRLTVMYAMNMLWCDLALAPDCGYGYRHPEILLYWLVENNEGGNLKYEADPEWNRFIFKEEYRCYTRYDLYRIEDDSCGRREDAKQVFEPVNRINGKLGERPVINIGGYRACLVEPKIYYFPEDGRYRGGYSGAFDAEINLNVKFEEPCFMLGFSTDIHPSDFCGIKYFGVGDEAVVRLREIAENTDYFFHSFGVKSEEEKRPMPLDDIFEDDLEYEFEKIVKSEAELRSRRESEIESLIKEGKAEVVVSGTPGLDFRNIKVYYKTLLNEAHEPEDYEFVYVKDGRLFLENITETFIKQTSVYVDAVTKLVVSKELPLKNGIDYPVCICVFDRKQEVKERFIREGLLEQVEETDAVKIHPGNN